MHCIELFLKVNYIPKLLKAFNRSATSSKMYMSLALVDFHRPCILRALSDKFSLFLTAAVAPPERKQTKLQTAIITKISKTVLEYFSTTRIGQLAPTKLKSVWRLKKPNRSKQWKITFTIHTPPLHHILLQYPYRTVLILHSTHVYKVPFSVNIVFSARNKNLQIIRRDRQM